MSKNFNDKTKKINSSTKTGRGYAPAHITTIFEIHNTNQNPLKCGSRGIGFCINKGVTTNITVKKNTKHCIDVIFNNHKLSGETTKRTIQNLIGKYKAKIEVKSYSELPLSQGFGLSGAGALSSAIALNSALNMNLEFQQLINAAHEAEVINKTGLGDVIAQANGGLVFRKQEGSTGFGLIETLKLKQQNLDIIICILGNELKTSRIISDQKHVKTINQAGKRHLKNFESDPSIENLLRNSFEFAKETKLIHKDIAKIIKEIHQKKIGLASMIMLGNALFAIGSRKNIVENCINNGDTFICRIDPKPARILA
jgi:pantoate kinase